MNRPIRRQMSPEMSGPRALPRVPFQPGPPTRTPLEAKTGDLAQISDRAWDAIVMANDPPVLFRRGRLIVRLESDDMSGLIPQTVNADRLRHRLARVGEWHLDGEPAPPPMDVVRDMLACPDPPLPALDRVVAVPVFAVDGSLGNTPGYHRPGRTYFAPSPGLHVPEVSAHPSTRQIARATQLILEDVLGDFPLSGPAERAHAVAIGLLPFVRDMVDGPTPLHVIEKPYPGTGATLLAEVLTTISTGYPATTLTEGRSEEEWRKRITAKLLAAPEVILVDNVLSRLSSAALAAAITASAWEDRILGRSHVVRLPVRSTWIATGNNPTLSSEMARRCVRIRLDAEVDRPWLRTDFRHPRLKHWVAENHGELVWAFLTVAMAWVAENRPPGDGPELGMFESWSRTLGGILRVAGIKGFLTNLAEAYSDNDAETHAWTSFVAAWWERFGDREVSTSDLFEVASRFLDLGNGADRSRRTRLGIALEQARDRRFEHLRLGRSGIRRGAAVWRLLEVGRTFGR